MARIVLNKIAWQYESDDGTTYRVNAIAGYTSQAKLGGAAAAASLPPFPRGRKMRRITVRNATNGLSRTVPVYSTDAAILTRGETVNLNCLVAGVEDALAFTNSNGTVIPEFIGRASTTTTQAA